MQIYTDNSYIIYIYKAVHTVLEVCDAHATHFSFINYKNCCTLELISAQIWYQVLSSVLLNSESSGWNIERVPRNFIHVFIHSELKFQFVLNKLLYSLDQTKYFNIYRKTAERYWKLAASPLWSLTRTTVTSISFLHFLDILVFMLWATFTYSTSFPIYTE